MFCKIHQTRVHLCYEPKRMYRRAALYEKKKKKKNKGLVDFVCFALCVMIMLYIWTMFICIQDFRILKGEHSISIAFYPLYTY